jgi:hypothetical protein
VSFAALECTRCKWVSEPAAPVSAETGLCDCCDRWQRHVHCLHPGFCWHDYPTEAAGIPVWSFFSNLNRKLLKCEKCGELFVDIGARGIVCYECFFERHLGCEHPSVCWERWSHGEPLADCGEVPLRLDEVRDRIAAHADRTGMSRTGVVERALRDFVERARAIDHDAYMRELESDPKGMAEYREHLAYRERIGLKDCSLPAWTPADDAAALAIEFAGGSPAFSEFAGNILEEQGFRQRLSLSALIAVAVSEYVERSAP